MEVDSNSHGQEDKSSRRGKPRELQLSNGQPNTYAQSSKHLVLHRILQFAGNAVLKAAEPTTCWARSSVVLNMFFMILSTICSTHGFSHPWHTGAWQKVLGDIFGGLHDEHAGHGGKNGLGAHACQTAPSAHHGCRRPKDIPGIH